MDVLVWVENGLVKFLEMRPESTKAELRRRFAVASQEDGAGITFVKKMRRDQLPADARFRACWEEVAGEIVLNMSKARLYLKQRVKQLWDVAGPNIKAKKRLAIATDDAEELAAANSELAAWQNIQATDASAMQTTEELWAVFEQAHALALPYLEEMQLGQRT